MDALDGDDPRKPERACETAVIHGGHAARGNLAEISYRPTRGGEYCATIGLDSSIPSTAHPRRDWNAQGALALRRRCNSASLRRAAARPMDAGTLMGALVARPCPQRWRGATGAERYSLVRRERKMLKYLRAIPDACAARVALPSFSARTRAT